MAQQQDSVSDVAQAIARVVTESLNRSMATALRRLDSNVWSAFPPYHYLILVPPPLCLTIPLELSVPPVGWLVKQPGLVEDKTALDEPSIGSHPQPSS